MAQLDEAVVRDNFLNFLIRRSEKKGDLDSSGLRKNKAEAKTLTEVYLASRRADGYLSGLNLVNPKTGNTGIRLGKPVGLGGQNLVCEGHIEDMEALNLLLFYINLQKHTLFSENGGGTFDDLRTTYAFKAQEEAEDLIRRGRYSRLRDDIVPILLSKFPNGKCAIRISIGDERPLQDIMSRSAGLDGYVDDNFMFSGARDQIDEKNDRPIQIVEFVPKFVDPADIHTTLSIIEIAEILKQSTRVLDFLNSYNLIHRDIKPDNIMVVKGKNSLTAKVADLDMIKIGSKDPRASMSKPGFKGSLQYASPEHLHDFDPNAIPEMDISSDICSLGLTAYTWLTGYKPLYESPDFTHMNRMEEVSSRLSKPVRLSYVASLAEFPNTRWYHQFINDRARNYILNFEKIIAKMIHLDNGSRDATSRKRYATPKELLRDLEKLTREEKVDNGVNIYQVFAEKRADIPTNKSRLF